VRNDATIHSIQLLRSIAATLVVILHVQQAFSGKVSPAIFPQEGYLFGFGAVGVHIFFVISGFIMVVTSCQPSRPYDARRFLKRRFLRIYPIYWVCALTFIGVHALMGMPYDLSPGEFFGAMLLWPADSPLIIGPAWTLAYEMFFYLCFGLAMMLSLTRGLIVLTAVFLGLIIVGAFVPNKGPALHLVTNTLLLEFLAGTGIGWLAQAGRLPLRWGPHLLVAGVAFFLVGISTGYDRIPSVASWGIPSALVVLGLVSWERAQGASPIVRRLGKLGDSSYVLYLSHILVITIAVMISNALPSALVLSPPVAALVITLVAIAVAEAIHRGVERPMLALLSPKRSLLPPRSKPAHQPELR
jgi:exopolysaccharide production protein ExoZ